jgi:formylglycine-generating enzyme required for sulfatase activity
VARGACEAAGKRLCSAFEWELACRGPTPSVYGYGSTYEPETCNGIDTFGTSGLHLLPTGALPGCVNGWGAFDVNGNLWEHVAEGDGTTVRGGAYNCIDSRTLHRCDYVPRSWVPSALGFRCCLTPEGAGEPGQEPTWEVVEAAEAKEQGCIDPDVTDAADLEVEAPTCHADAECGPLLPAPGPCERPACLPAGSCALVPVDDGRPCPDIDPCTLDETCQGGACLVGGTLGCDDANPCTLDACLAGSGCQHQPQAGGCDDGDPCTADDACQAGQCVAGAPICECSADLGCPDDGNPCNGALVCDLAQVPYVCVLDPASVVTCAPPGVPCQASVCAPASGQCELQALPDGSPCDDADPCNGVDACQAGQCVSGTSVLCGCPSDMVEVDQQFCLDRYEASRPDATSTSMGVDLGVALSREGVIPWFPVDYAQALAACSAAGKRLCTEAEVTFACQGTAGTVYQYGDTYSATLCNGIDAFCSCASPNCAGLEACPYPHCYSQSPEGGYGQGCGAAFHVVPTGSFSGCVNEWGAYDVNGNVWELVDRGDGSSWYKGGAYNCGDSEVLHRCDGLYQSISAKGFRCCREVGGHVGGR